MHDDMLWLVSVQQKKNANTEEWKKERGKKKAKMNETKGRSEKRGEGNNADNKEAEHTHH